MAQNLNRLGLVTCGLLVFTAGLYADSAPRSDALPLAGEWRFKLDADNAGIKDGWFGQSLPDKIRLPGSTDEGGFGTPNTAKPDYKWLSRLVEYTGPAWYQRDIEIPAGWQGRRIVLFLERCHWETRAWLDDTELGMQDSLCVPHVHELPAATSPGRHRLTVRVDNTKKYNMGGDAHSTSEQTQTNWNGIIGRIELQVSDRAWIDDVQVYPDVDQRRAKVHVVVRSATGTPASCAITLKANSAGKPAAEAKLVIKDDGQRGEGEAVLQFPPDAPLWDEFTPALYDLTLTLEARGDGQVLHDSAARTFALRKLSAEGRQLKLNNRNAFLRGTLECCIFPRTGYPTMDVAGWTRILKIAQSYGLNHMRFHSWCPPEAAFQAADQLGILFHVETPQWVFDVGQDRPRDAFIEEEVRRILRAYGNHPSFGMLCMGNELKGETAQFQKLVDMGRQLDPRHLYTSSTAWSLIPENDYIVALHRGLHGPTTDADFRDLDAKSNVPVISHEIGQWTVYPKIDEIKKYTGVLRARNFELIRDDLAAKGLLEQAADFTLASGKLSVLLYKEEIEVLLRTPGHAGFQLLDLHDFPGQGTALIGLLDAFWDSKGLITPEAYRRFCGPIVPLLRMKKRTYTSDETFTADAEIAHFGPEDLRRAYTFWTIRDAKGQELARGQFAKQDIAAGGLRPLGRIELQLKTLPAPARLTVTVETARTKDTPHANDWDIWVYPRQPATQPAADVVVSKTWDDGTRAALAGGKKVLLLASRRIVDQSLPGMFTTVFWSPIWFHRGADTMGILCDPAHPALAQFPTSLHTDWQWYDPLERSCTMVLDGLPTGFRPIVQVIDNFSRNHRLGNILEARVGDGRLLACSIDLESDLEHRPAARQLLASLVAYVNSEAFQPKQSLTPPELGKLFRAPLDLKTSATPPSDLEKAALRVKAGVHSPMKKGQKWNRKADEVLHREPGYDYTVQGWTWRDEDGSAWHDGRELSVILTCPKGFTGRLYAHMHDWNDLQRVADISLNGRFYDTLEKYNGPGVWLTFDVTPADTAEGKLVLTAHPTHTNAMISQVALVPEK